MQYFSLKLHVNIFQMISRTQICIHWFHELSHIEMEEIISIVCKNIKMDFLNNSKKCVKCWYIWFLFSDKNSVVIG